MYKWLSAVHFCIMCMLSVLHICHSLIPSSWLFSATLQLAGRFSLPRKAMIIRWEEDAKSGLVSIRACGPLTGKWCSTSMVSPLLQRDANVDRHLAGELAHRGSNMRLNLQSFIMSRSLFYGVIFSMKLAFTGCILVPNLRVVWMLRNQWRCFMRRT